MSCHPGVSFSEQPLGLKKTDYAQKIPGTPPAHVTISQYPSSFRHDRQKATLLGQLRSSRSAVSSHKGPRYRLLKALYGFQRYQEVNAKEIERLEVLYANIPSAQRKFIQSTLNYTYNFSKARELFSSNRHLVDDIVRLALEYYRIGEDELTSFGSMVEKDKDHRMQPDRTSISQALKHIVRDWSIDGQHERLATYPCILETLKEILSGVMALGSATPVKVLLPGAGLNRLAHEISLFGNHQVEVTTNEFSPYMNIVYQYLLSVHTPSSLHFYPYPDNWSHQVTLSELHRGVYAPDILPSSSDVVVIEGDFTHIFRHPEWPGSQDVLITHFFIDTARNFFLYIQTIHKLLRPGGIWINLGPLLWSYNAQLQLSLEEVVKLSRAVGFEFLETDGRWGNKTVQELTVRSVHAPYGFNHRTLSHNAYKAQFWVASKKQE
ncbi:uncharacterized protein A1O9_08989 [Exophiala aquamarina CBS 119918]|uniref:Uncharacterized protein n=1 Tax=Exophiala aquamarina CBS 119918 TaxID=1182545 RepID=A0A072P4B1_9EURO|nr:uncharacterized protein A1O9_08989 [Exophiala aquamarina CBS 119918]KEF54547.1 hypothetical protein A1O9_08989 [Exophiala aquamarina CBS 119918]